MRTIVIGSYVVFAAAAAFAQERAVLDSTAQRPQTRHHIVAGGGTVVSGGIINAEPKQLAANVTLRIESLNIVPPGTPADSAAGGNVIVYEVRLTNAGSDSIIVPIGTDLDAAADRCGSSQIEESSIGIELERDAGRWTHLPGRQSYWFGCSAISDTMLSLQPNEWITFKGSVRLPPSTNVPSNAMARWMLSDVTFSAGPGGLKEYTAQRMSVPSPEHVLQ